MTTTKEINWTLVLCIVVPNIGGWLGAVSVIDNLDWYDALTKAPWNPPSWVFGPVWTVLYSLLGWACHMILEMRTEAKILPAVVVYVLNLLLNWIWSPLFFSLHQLLWSFIEILMVLITGVICAVQFFHLKPMAGALLIPYLIWLCIATSLSYYIWTHNAE